VLWPTLRWRALGRVEAIVVAVPLGEREYAEPWFFAYLRGGSEYSLGDAWVSGLVLAHQRQRRPFRRTRHREDRLVVFCRANSDYASARLSAQARSVT
jgi:hypothetical protein